MPVVQSKPCSEAFEVPTRYLSVVVHGATTCCSSELSIVYADAMGKERDEVIFKW